MLRTANKVLVVLSLLVPVEVHLDLEIVPIFQLPGSLSLLHSLLGLLLSLLVFSVSALVLRQLLEQSSVILLLLLLLLLPFSVDLFVLSTDAPELFLGGLLDGLFGLGDIGKVVLLVFLGLLSLGLSFLSADLQQGFFGFQPLEIGSIRPSEDLFLSGEGQTLGFGRNIRKSTASVRTLTRLSPVYRRLASFRRYFASS